MDAIGLDLSLTGTGYATFRQLGTHIEVGRIKCGKRRGVERLEYLREQLSDTLVRAGIPDVAILEGYAFGRPQGMAGIGEWGGVARLLLRDYGIPFVEVPPSSLKKYATGKGNAKKDIMQVAAYERFKRKFDSDDECDAFWLMALGLEYYGLPLVRLPQANREVLAKLHFPELEPNT